MHLPHMHVQRMGTPNMPTRWLLMEIIGKSGHFGRSDIGFLQSRYHWLAKKVAHNNTKTKTHSCNQHQPPPPNPSSALPSPSMGRSAVPTTHGAMASDGPMLGTCGLVWWCHCWLACLQGANQHTSQSVCWCQSDWQKVREIQVVDNFPTVAAY